MNGSDTEPLIRWQWLADHPDLLITSAQQHLVLTAIALLLGTVISAILATISRTWRRTEAPITVLTTVLYTIPSIALFAALIPWFGTGLTVPAIALTTYALVVTTPFIITALDEVDPDVRSAAQAMGLTKSQQRWRVEVPLAMPAILAGLRVTATTVVGLVTVGGLFGFGGFGNLIDNGLSRDFPTLILTGIFGSVVLALLLDALLLAVQRLSTRWRYQ